MNVSDILQEAAAAGVTLRVDGGELKARGPRDAIAHLTPKLRKQKAAILAALACPPSAATAVPGIYPSPGHGVDCGNCANLLMTAERREDTRRVFFWRCHEGYQILEAGLRGERVLVAPVECQSWQSWKPGGGRRNAVSAAPRTAEHGAGAGR